MLLSAAPIECTGNNQYSNDYKYEGPKVYVYVVFCLQEQGQAYEDYYCTKYYAGYNSAVWEAEAFAFHPFVVFTLASWVSFAHGV